MTLEQIKEALEQGKIVHWASENYRVIKDSVGQYLIHSIGNDHYIGLTHQDGVTLNGREEQFYIADSNPSF